VEILRCLTDTPVPATSRGPASTKQPRLRRRSRRRLRDKSGHATAPQRDAAPGADATVQAVGVHRAPWAIPTVRSSVDPVSVIGRSLLHSWGVKSQRDGRDRARNRCRARGPRCGCDDSVCALEALADIQSIGWGTTFGLVESSPELAALRRLSWRSSCWCTRHGWADGAG
jgi:hypothetical protein